MASEQGKSGAKRGKAKNAGRDPAEPHRRTRMARAHEIAQDYVEVIAELIEERGEARAIDISRRLGVTHVTVNRTVARLRKQGLVVSERYRSIFLTPEGQALARDVRHRHVVVLDFLRALGVREDVARTDAEGIEHHVSEDTLRAFERFTNDKRRNK
jgi:DtxR family manganese transport transcriptional regulator